jgi:outer membrane protein TolC
MKGSMHNRTLAGVALIALAAVSLGRPVYGQTPAVPAASPTLPATTPAPYALPSPVPVASPISSLPPASSASALPYPAYGTPVPGVNRGVAVANVPQIVSLDQAIAIGFAKSPLLAQARAGVLIDTAPVDLAKTAVLPNISGTASVGRNYRQNTSDNTTTTGGTTTGGSGTTTGTTQGTQSFGPAYTTSDLSVTLKQLIYDGGKVAAEYKEAKATQSGAIATYKRQLQTVAYNIAIAYYAALSAQRATQVAEETVKLDQVNANLVAAEIRAGTAARSDYLTAELPVAQARVTLVRDQGTELSDQAAFVNAMGLEANTLVLPQDDGNVLAGASGAPKVATPSYDVAITRAYLLRPDYFTSQQAVLSYQYALKAARLGLFPNLNAAGSYGVAGSDPQGGTLRNSGSIGLTLSVPIFDQGITHAEVEQAQGNLDQAQAELTISQQSVQLNVKQTLVALIAAQAAFVQTQAELANAREVLQATQAQYAAGVTTLPLLLNSEVGLTSALADQVTAVYSLREAEAAFLYAEGANVPA